MKKNCFIFLIISILILSCTVDPLERTIFIPDQEDGNLPAYTEWGYNTFGAEYERDYFLASNRIVPCKIVYRDNHIHFALNGNVHYEKEMTLSFTFPFVLEDNDYTDLIHLHAKKIDLSHSDCAVSIWQNDVETPLDVLDGELYFKRAQLLSIDDQINRVILSGFFNVRFLQNGFPANISNGRFDLGITQNVFYAY
jgi:hypothetical protein